MGKAIIEGLVLKSKSRWWLSHGPKAQKWQGHLATLRQPG